MIDFTANIHIKDRILRAARQKERVICRDKPIKITTYFSIQVLKARRALRDIIQVMNIHK